MLRDFDINPDAHYAKMVRRVLAGLGLKLSMLTARPTQRRAAVAASAIQPSQSASRGQAPSSSWLAPVVVPVPALNRKDDDDDEVDNLNFDDDARQSAGKPITSILSQSALAGVAAAAVDQPPNATSMAAAVAAAAPLAVSSRPNTMPPGKLGGGRPAKRKADQAIHRGLEAFRNFSQSQVQAPAAAQHSSQADARGAVDDDEADALDI